MKIKTTITELECTVEEIRQSNTLADSLCNVFRKAFNGNIYNDEDDEDEEDQDE